ncbi:MAG TPA: hypothetical protein VF179_06335 [Thermoanaerobaculia bacterium]|nr:hypothetical protein [Thermoanaerobaculia bacterium]
MNFGMVLGAVSGFLEERGYRHAVIGGIALASYGLPRTTVDLDLVVESSAQDDLIRFLEARGYQTLNRSRGYSNHLHSDPDWGSLDFVYAGGETAEKLFAECQRKPGPGGLEVPVPKPEHLAALKVLAMKNDPARTFQELADIRFLLTIPGVDRHEIRDYFERQGLKDRYDELEKTL